MTRILTHAHNNTQESRQHLRTQIAPAESLEGCAAFNSSYQCMSAVGQAVFVFLCKTQNNIRQTEGRLLAACLPLISLVTTAQTQ